MEIVEKINKAIGQHYDETGNDTSTLSLCPDDHKALADYLGQKENGELMYGSIKALRRDVNLRTPGSTAVWIEKECYYETG